MPILPIRFQAAVTEIVYAGLLVAGVTAGCSQRKTPDESATWTGPPASAPPPHAAAKNPAPLNDTSEDRRVVGSAERAEDRVIDLGRHATRLELQPLGAQQTRGAAELEEVGGTVHAVVSVRSAPPGPLLVAIRERGPCTERWLADTDGGLTGAASDLGQSFADRLAVGRDGATKAELTVPHANLNARDPDTLLGKALVLARTDRPPNSASDVLACAQIRDR